MSNRLQLTMTEREAEELKRLLDDTSLMGPPKYYGYDIHRRLLKKLSSGLRWKKATHPAEPYTRPV